MHRLTLCLALPSLLLACNLEAVVGGRPHDGLAGESESGDPSNPGRTSSSTSSPTPDDSGASSTTGDSGSATTVATDEVPTAGPETETQTESSSSGGDSDSPPEGCMHERTDDCCCFTRREVTIDVYDVGYGDYRPETYTIAENSCEEHWPCAPIDFEDCHSEGCLIIEGEETHYELSEFTDPEDVECVLQALAGPMVSAIRFSLNDSPEANDTTLYLLGNGKALRTRELTFDGRLEFDDDPILLFSPSYYLECAQRDTLNERAACILEFTKLDGGLCEANSPDDAIIETPSDITYAVVNQSSDAVTFLAESSGVPIEVVIPSGSTVTVDHVWDGSGGLRLPSQAYPDGYQVLGATTEATREFEDDDWVRCDDEDSPPSWAMLIKLCLEVTDADFE